MTPETLATAIVIPYALAKKVAEPLTAAMEEFGIDSRNEVATFIAQLAHESRQFTRTEENLNYTPQALMATFNTRKIIRFDQATATKYGRTAEHPANQPMIASIAYANRMGNGDIESGDGWRNRGAGYIQLTGENNHAACAAHFRIPRTEIAAWLRTVEGACRSAGWFWRQTGLDRHDDDDDVAAETKVINGGVNGLPDRQAFMDRLLKVMPS